MQHNFKNSNERNENKNSYNESVNVLYFMLIILIITYGIKLQLRVNQ